MAEELQKYKDILKREREEFKKQLKREVSTSKFLLFRLKIDNIEIFVTVFSQNYDLISLSNFAVEFLQLYPSA